MVLWVWVYVVWIVSRHVNFSNITMPQSGHTNTCVNRFPDFSQLWSHNVCSIYEMISANCAKSGQGSSSWTQTKHVDERNPDITVIHSNYRKVFIDCCCYRCDTTGECLSHRRNQVAKCKEEDEVQVHIQIEHKLDSLFDLPIDSRSLVIRLSAKIFWRYRHWTGNNPKRPRRLEEKAVLRPIRGKSSDWSRSDLFTVRLNSIILFSGRLANRLFICT